MVRISRAPRPIVTFSHFSALAIGRARDRVVVSHLYRKIAAGRVDGLREMSSLRDLDTTVCTKLKDPKQGFTRLQPYQDTQIQLDRYRQFLTGS